MASKLVVRGHLLLLENYLITDAIPFLRVLWLFVPFYDSIFKDIFFHSVRGSCSLSDCRLRSRTLVDVLPVLHWIHFILLRTLADICFRYRPRWLNLSYRIPSVYEFITGTLRFGKVDVTEAQFGIITLHMITFFFGRGVWEMHVSCSIDHILQLVLSYNFKAHRKQKCDSDFFTYLI